MGEKTLNNPFTNNAVTVAALMPLLFPNLAPADGVLFFDETAAN